MHVFCAVTDPYVSGVGITEQELTSTQNIWWVLHFQPVEKAFDTARQMNPGLKKVGTVWCVSETCSEACINSPEKNVPSLD